jgi:ketosteroid isomerase-like protein
MFDVPPPEERGAGVGRVPRDVAGFFQWQARATFDLLSLEVVAGRDVAFAYGLLRCGTPEELAAIPDRRLRLTVGLHKVDGQWTVLHEHHSFTSRE